MILFRVDGNTIIGSGHIIRCMAIASKLKELGQTCAFVLADYSEMKNVVLEHGFEVIEIHGVGGDYDADLPAMRDVIQNLKPDVVLIDSYFVTEPYINKIAALTKVAIIDDFYMATSSCHMIINSTFNCDPTKYAHQFENASDKPILLLGPMFSPLRPEFENIIPKPLRTKVKKILVTTGATDSLDISGEIIKHVCQHFPKIQFQVVVGQLNPNLSKLQELCAKSLNVNIMFTPSNMAQLMLESDIAISAGGTTLTELCATRTPTICFSFVDNQVPGVKTLGESGIMLSVGDFRKSKSQFVNNLISAISLLCRDFDLRKSFRDKMSLLLNGDGCTLIGKQIIQMISNSTP